MMSWCKYLLWLPLLIGAQTLFAQTSFTASVDKNPVSINDRFRLTLTIQNAKGNITPPDLRDFNLIFGPAKSTNYQFINGETSSTISFTYTLSPKSTGTFTIGAAIAKTDQGNFQSDPITLTVAEAASSSVAGNGQGRSQNVQGDEDLLAEIRLDKQKVYKGEQVVVTYYVYSRYRNIDFIDYNFPATNGFFSHDFNEEQAGWLNNLEVINGKQYRVAVLRRQILFPQQHGTLEIDPMEIEARVDYSFFNPGRAVKVKSNKAKLEVLPLPPAPAGFRGDVGLFNFEVKTDRNTISANDAITLNVKISGRGNLKLVNAPEIKFPKDFEVYDPKVTNRFSTSGGSLSGSRDFEYLIIPRHAGSYTIEPIAYTYFDVVDKNYKTIRSDAISIEVERAEGSVATSGGYTGSTKQDVVILDQDIRYIKPAEKLQQRSEYFYKSPLFFGLMFFSPAFVLVFFIVRRKYIEQQQDEVSVRSRRAGRMAKKLLIHAKQKLQSNDREGFYDAVFKALYGYLGGKLNISPSSLSREQIRMGLEERNVESTVIIELMDLLSRCEIARFAPTSDLQPESDYQAAAKLIGELQKKIS